MLVLHTACEGPCRLTRSPGGAFETGEGQPRSARDPGRSLLGRPDVPGDRELPDLRRAGSSGDDHGVRPHQEGLRRDEPRNGPAGRRDRPRHRPGLRRDPRREASGSLRGGRLPGGRGGLVPHERERDDLGSGRGDPGQAARRPVGGPPQRPRQPGSVHQRHLPHRPAPRGALRRTEAFRRDRPARRVLRAQGRGVPGRRQVGAHPPDGRGPGDARPGVPRLCRGARRTSSGRSTAPWTS